MRIGRRSPVFHRFYDSPREIGGLFRESLAFDIRTAVTAMVIVGLCSIVPYMLGESLYNFFVNNVR